MCVCPALSRSLILVQALLHDSLAEYGGEGMQADEDREEGMKSKKREAVRSES